MKKIHIISISVVSLLFIITLVGFILINKKETTLPQSLSEIQEVNPTEIPQREIRLTAEKQKQLDQIGEIYDIYEDAYNTTLISVLKKYKSNYTEEDLQILRDITETQDGTDGIKTSIKEKLSISFLNSDIQKLVTSKERKTEEKELEMERIALFQEKNNADIVQNSRTLIEMTLTDSLSQESSLSNESIKKIGEQVSAEIFVDNNIFDTTKYDSFEKQQSLIEDSLSISLKSYSALNTTKKSALINQIIAHISELGVLLDSEQKNTSNDTSFFQNLSPIFDIFQNWGFSIFKNTYAAEELTTAQRAIAILKTQVQIEKLLQISIQTEIQYNNNEISLLQYDTIINENLTKIEELVILKDSLENDTIILTLDDIQRLNLGNYRDDSIEIENLTILAYIQEKSGHIIIENLNGSKKLGAENMLLYPGYSIETLNSNVTIVFSDESILQLEPYSLVTITTPNEGNIDVTVSRGNIWTRVIKPLLSGNTFNIITDDVSLGIRGTSLYISKDNTDTTIHIVDSYLPTGTGSVTLTDNNSGAQSIVEKSKKISINSSGAITQTNENRNTLLSNNSKIGSFIAEDLTYLSLTLDDRKRGFYNTPISAKNDSENFINKLIGELETSLPKTNEAGYIIKNPELAAQLINTGSIYHIIQKDIMITAIKESTSVNKAQKILAVTSLDMPDLETTLGNKRAIENRFDYEIIQDVISNTSTSFNSGTLKDIFLKFPIKAAEDNKRLLEQVKKDLSPNNGNNIVTGDINPPTYLSGVTITWKSESPDILSNTGLVNLPTQSTDVIYTATLKKGNLTAIKDFGLVVNPKQLTDAEKLDIAGGKLDRFINNVAQNIFIDSVLVSENNGVDRILDFTENNGVTPIITWTGSIFINSDGTTNRPSFILSPINEYKYIDITATLIHPQFPKISIEKRYTIGVKRKAQTPEELLTQVANGFWDSYITSNDGNTGLSVNIQKVGAIYNILNNLSFPSIKDTVNVSYITTGINHSYYVITKDLAGNYNGTKNAHCQYDKPITIQATFSLAGLTPITNERSFVVPKDGEMIGGECYTLVASAEYNTAGDIDLKSSTGAIIPRPASGNINLNTCGANPNANGSVTGGTGNCGWTSTGVLAGMYNYTPSKITAFNPLKSWMTYDGQSGIVIENVGDADYLPYDLSSLDLGENWAIEMSVRGEDLKRSGSNTYFLLNSPSNFGLFAWNKKIGVSYNTNTYDIGGITNDSGYKKIILTKNKIYKDGIIYKNISEISLGSTINIASDKNYINQWNGIINYLKIYKKN